MGPVFLYNVVTEGGDGQTGQFEMLHAEGDADDGDAEDQPEKEMGQKYPYSPDKKPDDIHEEGKTTATLREVYHLATERPEGQHSEFQGLYPERNSDDRDKQTYAGYKVFQCDEETAEQDPDDISKNFHVLSCFIMIFQRYDKECNLGTGEKGTCNLL